MMVILSSIAINNSVEGGEMLYSVSKLAFFLIIWFVVGVFVLPSLLNSQRRFLNSRLFSSCRWDCVSVWRFFRGVWLLSGSRAFVMGSILAGSSFAERIRRSHFLSGSFWLSLFLSVGMMVNPHIIVEYGADSFPVGGRDCRHDIFRHDRHAADRTAPFAP